MAMMMVLALLADLEARGAAGATTAAATASAQFGGWLFIVSADPSPASPARPPRPRT